MVGVLAAAVVAVGAGLAIAASTSSSSSGDDDREERADPTTTAGAEPEGAAGPPPPDGPERTWGVEVGTEPDDTVHVVSDGDRTYTQASWLESSEGEVEGLGELVAWSAYGEELWWTELEVPALSDAPLAVDDGVITRERDEALSSVSRLLDGATGNIVWEADGVPAGDYEPGGSAAATLAAADLIVYERIGPDSHTGVVDAATGEAVWTVDAHEPRVCGDVVVAQDDYRSELDTTVRAWRIADGTELWSTTGSRGRCDDRSMAVVTADDTVALVDLATGASRSRTVAPTLADDALVVAAGDGVVVNRLGLTGGGPTSALLPIDGGDALWEAEATALPDGDRLVVADASGALTTVAFDGSVIGSVDLPGSPCGGGVTVVLVCDGTEVSAVTVDPEPAVLWTVDVGGEVRAGAGDEDGAHVLVGEELVAVR